MSLGIIGIDHVQIAVPEALEAECLAFYREVFGFPEIPKPEELRADWQRARKLVQDDLTAAKAKVLARGVAIEEENVAEGLSRFFIRDPAGNRIEIGMRG